MRQVLEDYGEMIAIVIFSLGIMVGFAGIAKIVAMWGAI